MVKENWHYILLVICISLCLVEVAEFMTGIPVMLEYCLYCSSFFLFKDQMMYSFGRSIRSHLVCN